VDALSQPQTRIVTLTITASAYRQPDPDRCVSAVALLVDALDRRRRAGLDPFTVLSCDNVPSNGELTREAVVGMAAGRSADLAAWIDRNGAFPSSMVDRITPRTTIADREWVAREFGVADAWPVITEPFSQWVVEDNFCNGRPPLDEVGVELVSDVRPYSLLKTRLLNASHCALGQLGALAGHEYTDETMDDPVFSAYVARLMDAEVSPLLPRVAGVELGAYKRTLIERLGNPKIRDDLARLRRNASSKMPTHVLSSICEARARGRAHPMLTLAVAGWCRQLQDLDDTGELAQIDDPLADLLQPLAVLGGTDPRPLLAERSVFGTLGADPGFAAELERALVAIDRDGARAVIAAHLDEDRELVA
jgi:mannitol-1-phosphate/altronate dehydrogenase